MKSCLQHNNSLRVFSYEKQFFHETKHFKCIFHCTIAFSFLFRRIQFSKQEANYLCVIIMLFKVISKHALLLLALLTVFDYCTCNNGNTISTETPGFFLKVTKNVPRLGRRSQPLSDFENFFLKTSKSVPRIGRSDGSVSAHTQKFASIFSVDCILCAQKF